MAEYYRVREPFAYGNDIATVNQIWSSDNPAFKGREQYFEPIEVSAARIASVSTETASAAPGERRARTRSQKPAAAKESPKEES